MLYSLGPAEITPISYPTTTPSGAFSVQICKADRRQPRVIARIPTSKRKDEGEVAKPVTVAVQGTHTTVGAILIACSPERRFSNRTVSLGFFELSSPGSVLDPRKSFPLS